MNRSIFIFLFIIIATTSKAAVLDSTYFSSKYEKELFTKYINDSNSVLPVDFLYALNYSNIYTEESCKERDDKVRTSISRVNEQLIEIGIKDKPAKKKVKTIYSHIHDQFFRKYKERVDFTVIFLTGTYKCATASALYCIFLESFNVPYDVMEKPNHVYIIADPKNKPILMESTNPVKGVLVFDDKYKTNFVNYLKSNKIISLKEFNLNTVDELFEKYHNKDTKINFKQLIGLLYCNRGIFLYDKTRYEEAMAEFHKAQILYPSSPTIKYILYATYLQVLYEDVKQNRYNATLLANFINSNQNNDETMIFSDDYFASAVKYYLYDHSDCDRLDQFYDDFTSKLDSTIKIDNIKHSYYYAGAYYYETKGIYSKAIQKLHQAYILNPSNVENQGAIQSLTQNYLASRNDFDIAIDSASAFLKRYPFLKNHNGFVNNYYYFLARKITDSYNYGFTPRGSEYFQKFEQLIETPEVCKPKPDIVSAIYSTVSAYYVSKRNFAEAERYANKGLYLCPNSAELLQQKRSIESGKQFFKNAPTYKH